jgi:SAM-dependent methyltransferase
MIRSPDKMGVVDFFDLAYKRYPRYWFHPNAGSTDPADFPPAWSRLLRELESRPPGRALDLGAGEGSDAIRLGRLGYEVDAIEASAIGAEKIERFARQAGVDLNVKHHDARTVGLEGLYDLVICNGLLHYLSDKESLIRRMQAVTRPGGFNLVFLFSDATPVPECHRLVDVFPDHEQGIVATAYADWSRNLHVERDKLERSHPGFPPHRHSMIKLLARKPPSSDHHAALHSARNV